MAAAASISIWSTSVRRDPAVRRAARFVAWFLADWPLFSRAGCRATDEEIAAEICAAPNTVKNSILELRARGHLDWTWRRIRGSDVRTLFPVVATDHFSASLGTETTAPTVGADANLEPADLRPVECLTEEVPASHTNERRETGRGDLWSRYGTFSYWPPTHQRAHVQRLVNRLPNAGWNARCGEIGCTAEAAYICAEEGDTYCGTHRRYAGYRVPLASFGLGPESYPGRPQDDGDFRGW